MWENLGLSLSDASWERKESLQQLPGDAGAGSGWDATSSHHPLTRGGVSYSNKNAPFHLGDCSQLEMKTFVLALGVIPGIATPRLCFQLSC